MQGVLARESNRSFIPLELPLEKTVWGEPKIESFVDVLPHLDSMTQFRNQWKDLCFSQGLVDPVRLGDATTAFGEAYANIFTHGPGDGEGARLGIYSFLERGDRYIAAECTNRWESELAPTIDLNALFPDDVHSEQVILHFRGLPMMRICSDLLRCLVDHETHTVIVQVAMHLPI